MAISSVLGSSALLPAGLGFRNVIINGDMRIAQRGNSVATGLYTLDRWVIVGTGTVTKTNFAAGSSSLVGVEASSYLNWTITSNQQNAEMLQRVEDVRTCAGQTVTLSFWARSTAGAQLCNTNIYQYYGTGGSSLTTTGVNGTFTPTSTWTKYVFTGVIPSVAGKTIGTDSYLWVRVAQLTATTANTSLDIWGVQLEMNYQPTPFEQRPISTELELCQRYYETSYDLGTAPATATEAGALYSGCSNANALDGGSVRFRVVKRATPTVRTFNTANGNWNQVTEFTENPRTYITPRSIAHIFIGTTGYVVHGNQQLASGRFYGFHYEASAEL